MKIKPLTVQWIDKLTDKHIIGLIITFVIILHTTVLYLLYSLVILPKTTQSPAKTASIQIEILSPEPIKPPSKTVDQAQSNNIDQSDTNNKNEKLPKKLSVNNPSASNEATPKKDSSSNDDITPANDNKPEPPKEKATEQTKNITAKKASLTSSDFNLKNEINNQKISTPSVVVSPAKGIKEAQRDKTLANEVNNQDQPINKQTQPTALPTIAEIMPKITVIPEIVFNPLKESNPTKNKVNTTTDNQLNKSNIENAEEDQPSKNNKQRLSDTIHKNNIVRNIEIKKKTVDLDKAPTHQIASDKTDTPKQETTIKKEVPKKPVTIKKETTIKKEVPKKPVTIKKETTVKKEVPKKILTVKKETPTSKIVIKKEKPPQPNVVTTQKIKKEKIKEAKQKKIEPIEDDSFNIELQAQNRVHAIIGDDDIESKEAPIVTDVVVFSESSHGFVSAKQALQHLRQPLQPKIPAKIHSNRAWRVTVVFYVSKQGNVLKKPKPYIRSRQSSGSLLIDENALEIIAKAKFKPFFNKKGQPIVAEIELPLIYRQ